MDIFNALADPNRRRILELLAQSGRLSATNISEKFKISAPAVSQHLKVLRESGLVNMDKKAQSRIYSLNRESMYAFDSWVKKMTQNWDERLVALDKLLEEEMEKSKDTSLSE